MHALKKKLALKRANNRQAKIRKALKSEKVLRSSVQGAIRQQRELAGLK